MLKIFIDLINNVNICYFSIIICNFILFQTASIELCSYFSKLNFGVIIWLDVVTELILSSDNPLDCQKYIQIPVPKRAIRLKYLTVGWNTK